MYEIEHIAPLTQIQKDALARSITDIHSNKFTTPRLFVNVKITDATHQQTYVAGRPVRYRIRFMTDDAHHDLASIKSYHSSRENFSFSKSRGL